MVPTSGKIVELQNVLSLVVPLLSLFVFRHFYQLQAFGDIFVNIYADAKGKGLYTAISDQEYGKSELVTCSLGCGEYVRKANSLNIKNQIL